MNNRQIDKEQRAPLLDAIFSGDAEKRESAFQQFVTEFLPGLHRVARSVGLDASSAEDAVQVALMNVWKKILDREVAFNTVAAFRGYCMTATRRAAIDMIRKGKKVSELPDPNAVSSDTRPDEDVIRREEKAIEEQRLAECVEKLQKHNPEYFAVAIRRLGAMAVLQIATELHLKSDQVHRRWHSAKDWLTTCVQGGAA